MTKNSGWLRVASISALSILTFMVSFGFYTSSIWKKVPALTQKAIRMSGGRSGSQETFEYTYSFNGMPYNGKGTVCYDPNPKRSTAQYDAARSGLVVRVSSLFPRLSYLGACDWKIQRLWILFLIITLVVELMHRKPLTFMFTTIKYKKIDVGPNQK